MSKTPNQRAFKSIYEEKTYKMNYINMKGKDKSNKKNNSFITTIKIEIETKERLERMKEHGRETYNEVIRKLLYIINQIKKDPLSANKILSKIEGNIKRKEIYMKKLPAGDNKIKVNDADKEE
jgi:hypothetical protein